MDEILSRANISSDPPGAFTLRQFMARSNLSKHIARSILDAEVKSGRLLFHRGSHFGTSNICIWWKNAD